MSEKRMLPGSSTASFYQRNSWPVVDIRTKPQIDWIFFKKKKRIPTSGELLDWVIVPPFCILDAGGQAWDLHSRAQTTKKERIADSEKSLRILQGRTVCPYTQYIRSASNIAQVVFNTNQHLIWVIAKYYMYIIGSLIIVVTGYL